MFPASQGAEVSNHLLTADLSAQLISISKSNILTLPNEILIKILSYVATSDLLIKVATISNKFYEFSKDPHVHICVTLSDTIEARYTFHQLFRSSFSIQKCIKSSSSVLAVCVYMFWPKENVKSCS